MRLRGAVKPTVFALPFAARTCHAWLARLTRARGRRFLRGWKILLNDFWYFWSLKSTIREKFIYASSRETVSPTNSSSLKIKSARKKKSIFLLFLCLFLEVLAFGGIFLFFFCFLLEDTLDFLYEVGSFAYYIFYR